MKKSLKFLILMFLSLVLALEPTTIYAKTSNTVKVNVKGTELYDFAFRELELMNKERKKNGMKALVMDKVLIEVAMQRAHECILLFGHTRPNGLNCHTARKIQMEEVFGENIAMGQKTPEWVTRDWMNSAGHKENILDEEYNAVGIGCVKFNGRIYWTQYFCSTITKKVKKSSYKNKVKSRAVEVKKSSKYYKASFSVDSTRLKVGQTTKIHTLWDGIELENSGVTGESSDTAVCKIKNGRIIATGEGIAKVKIYFGGYKRKL